MNQLETAPLRANYGIDAPTVVRTQVIVGIILVALGIAAQIPARTMGLFWLALVGAVVLWGGAWCLIIAAVMLWGSLVGKVRVRDRVLASIEWRGDEHVLDVGCGHGLMAIGAARRLKNGRVIGLDLWREEDQAANTPEATMANASAEGVADRIELRDGDARQMPFPDSTFDVVLSSWAIHNIDEPAERERAITEIVRVLRPGGRAVIVDIRHAPDYAAVFERLGMRDVRLQGRNFLFVTPTRTVRAIKPVAEPT